MIKHSGRGPSGAVTHFETLLGPIKRGRQLGGLVRAADRG